LAAISSFAGRQRQQSPDISEYIIKLLEQTGIANPDTDYSRLAEIAVEQSLPGMLETTKETVGDIGKAAQWMYDTPVVEQVAAGVRGLDKVKSALPKVVDVVSEQPGEVADAITGGLKQGFYDRGVGGVAGIEDVVPFGMAMGMAGKVPKLVKTIGAAKIGDKVTPDFSGDELSTLAKAQFGRTDDPYQAGYIMDDGDMLDFSGGVSDEPYFAGHTRNRDHREISSLETGAGDMALIDVRNDPGSAHGYMVDFMNRTNAVRISVSPGMGNKPPFVDFEFAGVPSRMQQVKMRKIMKQINADHAAFDLVDNEGRGIRSTAVDMPQGYHLEAFLNPDPDDLEDYGMTIYDNMGNPMSREAIEALSTPEASSDVPKLIQTVGSSKMLDELSPQELSEKNNIVEKFGLSMGLSPTLTEKLKTSELLDSSLNNINNKQDLDQWIGQVRKNDPDKYQEIISGDEWWRELRGLVENNPTQWRKLRKEVEQKELRKKIGGFDKDVYHGSTFNISEFKTENLNPSSYMGRGHYFTTSPEDASVNYASLDSPDIKAKNLEIKDALREKEIERIKKQLKELDDLSLEEQKRFNQENPEAWNALHDELWDLEKNKTDKFLSKLGQSYLRDDIYFNDPTLAKYTAEDIKAIDPNLPVIGENQGTVYDISLAVKNPFRINSDDAVFYRNYKYDANGELISDDEGSYGDLLDAIWEVSTEWSKNEAPDLDPNKVVARFSEYVDHRNADLDGEGLTPREVHRALKHITEFADKDIGYFDVMELRPEFRRQIYERLGFDSVIMNPKDAFPKLMENFDDDIEHVIVFPKYANRIRSQRAQFDPEKSHLSDIMATSTPIGVGAAGGYAATKEDK
jgi:hypothetical protein